MIVSHQHNFVFMHNPKAGGTSVRRTLERFSDSEERFFLNDPDPESPLHKVDRAHIGLEEFARYYPDVWARCQSYQFFALWRTPRDRLFSSLQEYSRHFAETDIRFLAPVKRRDFLMSTLEMLEQKYGVAENLLGSFELTHFRPQWIYLEAPSGRPNVTAISLRNIDQLFAEVGARVGEPELTLAASANASERLALPAGLSGLLANNRRKMMIRAIPGVPFLIGLARKVLAHQPRQDTRTVFALSEADNETIDAFLARFYQLDFERLPLT